MISSSFVSFYHDINLAYCNWSGYENALDEKCVLVILHCDVIFCIRLINIKQDEDEEFDDDGGDGCDGAGDGGEW